MRLTLAARGCAARFAPHARALMGVRLAHTISPTSKVPTERTRRVPNVDPTPQRKTANKRKTAAPARGSALDASMIGMTGGEIFHEMMLRHNVDTIFGYSGGAILPVFDGIYNSEQFQFVLPRHEQGAGHMAEGYARATGKPGIVLVTSGPGATNVVTPMQDALSDGTPMVVFTGQVATSAIGTDAFQEADVVGITRSCTKWAVMVKSIEDLPKRINEAFEIATSGRPGPVLVDLPKDVTAGILRKAIPTESTIPSRLLADLSSTAAAQEVVQGSIAEAADLLNNAKRPVLLIGNGAMNGGVQTCRQLADLAIRANVPVATTLHGLGAFDQNNALNLGMVGMHGTYYANRAVQAADVIVAVGARFDERVTGRVADFAPQARLAASENRGGIIHFEIQPKNISKVVDATVAIEGDLVETVPRFAPLVTSPRLASQTARSSGKGSTLDTDIATARTEWLKQIAEWKLEHPMEYGLEVPCERIRPQTVIETLSEVVEPCREKVILTTGVGQHQMWAAQFFKFAHPRSLATSGGLGTMGYGLPAAIGAKVGRPDAHVIDIDGDGSFNMTLSELSTAAMYDIAIKAIVFNNEELGMVTQWQSMFYENRFAHTHQMNPDYMKLADAMGVVGIRVSKLEELRPALERMLAEDKPVLLEVLVESKVPVLPLVPGGKSLEEMVLYDGSIEVQRRQLLDERNKRIAEAERKEYDT